MKPWERRLFNTLALVLTVTGVAYFWMKYIVELDDPFAVVNHPWQGVTLQLHLLASPAFILIFGVVLSSHIMKKLRALQPRSRRSGLLSLATFGTMALSGYLLQIVTVDTWLQGLVVLHVGSGVLFAVAYGTHLLLSAGFLRTRVETIRGEVA